MKKGIVLSVFLLLLVGVRSEAQVCGRVNGTLAVPTITLGAGCVNGAAVTRAGVGLFKLTARSGSLIMLLVTPLDGSNSGDFIATVRRADPATVFVRTYRVGRACPPNVPLETACGQANITRADVDFSFEMR